MPHPQSFCAASEFCFRVGLGVWGVWCRRRIAASVAGIGVWLWWVLLSGFLWYFKVCGLGVLEGLENGRF